MLNNLLLEKNLINGKWITTVSIGEAAMYAAIGFAVVFLGILLLVLIVWVVGCAMQHFPKKGEKRIEKSVVKKEEFLLEDNADDLDAETVAVIMAAVAAYYDRQQIPCDFVVKKIKRISK